ncbi:short-chain dehydrogenase, partial [Streptomyces nigra]
PHGTTVAAAAHPGVSNTELLRHLPAPLRVPAGRITPLLTQDPAMGALPTLRAATDPAVTGGQYYGPGGRGEIRGYPKLVTSSPGSHDETVMHRLWTVSEELTGVTFPVERVATAS